MPPLNRTAIRSVMQASNRCRRTLPPMNNSVDLLRATFAYRLALAKDAAADIGPMAICRR
jgi:hypothetical protein